MKSALSSSGDISRLLVEMGQVAQRFSIHRRTIEREIARGHFPRPLKIGRKCLFREADLEAYLHRLEEERDRHVSSERSADSP